MAKVPADYIIYGDYVVTVNTAMDVISNGAVAVKDNIIIAVGDATTLFKKYPEAKVLGGKGQLVMPGLVNTHNHAPMVYLRGIADDLPLKEWLEEHIWPKEGKWVGSEFVSDATKLACLEMLQGGTTTFADMYFYCDAMARSVKSVGLRAVLGETGFDFPTAAVKSLAEYFQRAEEFIQLWQDEALIKPSIAPHSPYACCPETLKKVQHIAHKYNAPIHIHVAETEWEVQEIKSKYGKRPVEHLDAIGFLNEHVIAAHCVWLDPHEIEILAKRKVGVAHCIESNLKLASGIAPIPAMLREGVKVGLGTDGAASNNDLNMFSEIATAAKVHKLFAKDLTALDAKTAVLMATKRGAEVLGYNNLGFLAPGALADIITLDLERAHLLPLYNVYSHLVYAANAADVVNVMVNGEILLHNGEVISCDVAEILAKAHEWNRKII
ncbi:MAG: amidohydrolase [Gammaproteobacteria bacterium]|nr:amidohydrolase [Gammaproteobacteria bacterium]